MPSFVHASSAISTQSPGAVMEMMWGTKDLAKTGLCLLPSFTVPIIDCWCVPQGWASGLHHVRSHFIGTVLLFVQRNLKLPKLYIAHTHRHIVCPLVLLLVYVWCRCGNTRLCSWISRINTHNDFVVLLLVLHMEVGMRSQGHLYRP